MNEGFLGTAAPRYADVILLLEFGMGVALLIGAVLARMRRFRLHAWCQSVIVLLNLAVIVLVMLPSFHVHAESEDTGQTWQGLLRTGDRAWGARKRHGNSRVIYITFCGHERSAAKFPADQINLRDAESARPLVARAPVGTCNIRPLVRPAFVSEMNSRSLFS